MNKFNIGDLIRGKESKRECIISFIDKEGGKIRLWGDWHAPGDPHKDLQPDNFNYIADCELITSKDPLFHVGDIVRCVDKDEDYDSTTIITKIELHPTLPEQAALYGKWNMQKGITFNYAKDCFRVQKKKEEPMSWMPTAGDTIKVEGMDGVHVISRYEVSPEGFPRVYLKSGGHVHPDECLLICQLKDKKRDIKNAPIPQLEWKKEPQKPNEKHLELAKRIFGVTGGSLLLDEANDIPAIAALLAEAYDHLPKAQQMPPQPPALQHDAFLLKFKGKRYVALVKPWTWQKGDLTFSEEGEILGPLEDGDEDLIGTVADGTLQGFREITEMKSRPKQIMDDPMNAMLRTMNEQMEKARGNPFEEMMIYKKFKGEDAPF